MIGPLIDKAQKSAYHRWILNRVLWWKIPFNNPHRIEIIKVEEDAITMLLPYRRSNKNHINGMHACALATLCEYISGISLARVIDVKKYRFILQKLEITYKYQAKKQVTARLSIPERWINDEVIIPLQKTGTIVKELNIELFDNAGNLICIGNPVWQIKTWESVKTKI